MQKLSDLLKERPVIEASCYLPLNAAIVTHLFLSLEHTLPRTLHEVFTLLVINCIIRHMKKKGEGISVSSLDDLPPDIQKHFNNLCSLAYCGVKDNKVTFSQEDLLSFNLPTELSTLSLIQGTTSFSASGESKLYNFLHLSTQELLAAFFISKMQPLKQVKIFNDLFTQPRFSAVFQFYAAFTKLQTEGIQNTISSIIRSENKTLLLSLLRCLYENQDDTLCRFVTLQELNLFATSLSPVDCLAVGYFVNSLCFTTGCEFTLKLSNDRIDEYGASLLVAELSKYCSPNDSQPETAVKPGVLGNVALTLEWTGINKSPAMKLIGTSTIISKLDLSTNVLHSNEAAKVGDALRLNRSLKTLKYVITLTLYDLLMIHNFPK